MERNLYINLESTCKVYAKPPYSSNNTCKSLKILFTNFMIEQMLFATTGIAEKSSIIVLDDINNL
jgi:hypothetical protein